MKLIEHASPQKIRGGFYTPKEVADFILKWSINGSSSYDILEPSCGDGVFIEQLKQHRYNTVTAIELDAEEAAKSDRIVMKRKSVINMDFHVYCNETNERFDLALGNPPYIRYQYFNEKQQKEAEKVFLRRKNLAKGKYQRQRKEV